MDDINDASTTTSKIFRFGSGELLILEQDQIEQIPYLSALVSSADNFESIYNEHGHYKLNPLIESKQFSFVVKSLSFRSVTEIFTQLPEGEDILTIIALFDFLGIGPQPDPTLNEVDSAFFANLIYSPFLGTHVQVIRPSILQEMAVRFAFAMAKEEYDLTDCQVINQLYWFIMFILSAYKLFGPGLRHHVQTIAEHCFSLFSPFRTESLKKLVLRITNETKGLIISEKDLDPDKEKEPSWEEDFYRRWFSLFPVFKLTPVERHRQFLFNRSYRDTILCWWRWIPSDEEKLLKQIRERVLEIMYERLQSEICQRKYVNKDINQWILHDLLQRELVQEEMCNHIRREINLLIPTIEDNHRKLLEGIRKYEQSREPWHIYGILSYLFLYEFDAPSFEGLQEKALSYELMLNKWRQLSLIVEQVRQDLVDKLHEIARKQMKEWENTDKDIAELRQRLAFSCSPGKLLYSISRTTNRNYPIHQSKSLPKIQRKYSKR